MNALGQTLPAALVGWSAPAPAPLRRSGPPPMTAAGSSDVEQRIEQQLRRVCVRLRDALGNQLRGVFLVGGYARGEGAVVERGGQLQADNDYDLVVVVAHGARALRATLPTLAGLWRKDADVEIDLWPIDQAALPQSPPTLFWLDVSLGGVRLLEGDAALLRALPRHTPGDVPLEEVGRLLANRAVGLALSNLSPEHRGEAVRARHVHKAVLACGDAQLLAAGRYRATHAERLIELDALRDAPGGGERLVRAYAEAVRYRRRPDRWRPLARQSSSNWYLSSLALLERWHLGFEHARTGAPTQPQAFGAHRGRLFPVLPDVHAGGSVLRALSAASAGAASWTPFLGHPRERLARVAVLLAYAAHDPAARGQAQRLLGASDDADATLLAALLRLLPYGS